MRKLGGRRRSTGRSAWPQILRCAQRQACDAHTGVDATEAGVITERRCWFQGIDLYVRSALCADPGYNPVTPLLSLKADC